MKRFLIALIIGGCLIGSGLAVSFFELAEWSESTVSPYELGYKEVSDEYHFQLTGKELKIYAWLVKSGNLEIIEDPTLSKYQVIVSVSYPEKLTRPFIDCHDQELWIHNSGIDNPVTVIKLALQLLENKTLVVDSQDEIRVVIRVHPDIETEIFN